jgi:hypothetical protein
MTDSNDDVPKVRNVQRRIPRRQRSATAEALRIIRSPVTIATVVGAGLSIGGLFEGASLENEWLLAGQFFLFGGQACAQVRQLRDNGDDEQAGYRWGNGVLAVMLSAAALCAGFLYFSRSLPEGIYDLVDEHSSEASSSAR